MFAGVSGLMGLTLILSIFTLDYTQKCTRTQSTHTCKHTYACSLYIYLQPHAIIWFSRPRSVGSFSEQSRFLSGTSGLDLIFIRISCLGCHILSPPCTLWWTQFSAAVDPHTVDWLARATTGGWLAKATPGGWLSVCCTVEGLSRTEALSDIYHQHHPLLLHTKSNTILFVTCAKYNVSTLPWNVCLWVLPNNAE